MATTYTAADIAREVGRSVRSVGTYRRKAESKAGKEFGSVGEDARKRLFSAQEKALIIAEMPERNTGSDVGSVDGELVEGDDISRKVYSSGYLQLQDPVLAATTITRYDSEAAAAELSAVRQFAGGAFQRFNELLGQEAAYYAAQTRGEVLEAISVAGANAAAKAAGIMGKPQEPPTAGQ